MEAFSKQPEVKHFTSIHFSNPFVNSANSGDKLISLCPSEPFRYAFSPLVDEVSEEEGEQLMNEAFGKSLN